MIIINIDEIVKMYNDENLSLSQIGDKISKSKSSVKRMLNNAGWFYDKDIKKFVFINKDINKDINKNLNKTVVNSNKDISYTTVGIYNDIFKALKIKCAVENLKQFEVINNALKDYIELKYFDI